MMRPQLPTEILDAAWTAGRDCTLIKYADAEKVVRVTHAGMHPYMFIKRSDLERARKHFKNRVVSVEDGKFVSLTGHRVVKLNVRIPSDVHSSYRDSGLRKDLLEEEGIGSFESDIPFVKRWMIDQGIYQCPITEKVYVDIEVEARAGFPDPEEATNQIISIAASGSDGKKFFFCTDDEPSLLLDYYAMLKKNYQMITGWNWKAFDNKYLNNRMKRLELKPGWVPIQEIDAMLNYTKLTIWGFVGKSYTLDTVAHDHLGVDHRKMKREMTPAKMWESFVGDHKELYTYNMMDADLVRQLDEKLRICDPYIEVTRLYPILLRDTPFMSRVIDIMLLREATRHEWRLVFPRREEHTAELLGGRTLTPQRGVYIGVFSLDFKSLYPTVIISFGLSPELMYLFQAWRATKKPFNEWVLGLFELESDNDMLPPEEPASIPRHTVVDLDQVKLRGRRSKVVKPKALNAEEKYQYWKANFRQQMPHYVKFMKAILGLGIIKYPFMANELKNLLGLREDIKKKMQANKDQYGEASTEFMAENIRQAAIKLVLVSSYGVTGYRNTRFFNDEFVNATTGLSQTCLETLCDIADELGYAVIYGDTDSVFLKPKGVDVHPIDLTLLIEDFAKQADGILRSRLLEEFGIDEDDYIIELNAENVYSKITFTDVKKKYIGDCIWVEGRFEKKRKVVGFETKRSDACELVSDVQMGIIDILHSDTPVEEVENEVFNYIAGTITTMFTGELDKKLVLAMTLRKSSIDAYKTTSPHVRVAKKLKDLGEFRPGDKVRWIVVDNGVETPVLYDKPLPKPSNVGYAYYANKLLGVVGRMIGTRPPFIIDNGLILEQTRLDL